MIFASIQERNVKSGIPVARNKEVKQPVEKNVLRQEETYSTTSSSEQNSEPKAHLPATHHMCSPMYLLIKILLIIFCFIIIVQQIHNIC
jgi:hypothetical protein